MIIYQQMPSPRLIRKAIDDAFRWGYLAGCGTMILVYVTIHFI